MKPQLLFTFLLLIFGSRPSLAGTNGILEGFVKDKKTGEGLPGVNVLLVGTKQGTATGQDGRYEIQNIRAGRYEVRYSFIGYQTYVMRNVIINPDLRTRLNVELQPTDVELEEIVVLREKPLIQKDVTGTTFIVSSEEIEALPIDNVRQVIGLKAGSTLEGHVRGGKTSEVVYLVDGLPVQDVIQAEQIQTYLPLQSLV
ncbi:MAG: carboxypeptidase-like regulatory domain-containing protein [Ignavibacteria bacterium]|nr:carboxypeptidase-like regulatory domain-containing protein [Ignavibacteria bacterium]